MTQRFWNTTQHYRRAFVRLRGWRRTWTSQTPITSRSSTRSGAGTSRMPSGCSPPTPAGHPQGAGASPRDLRRRARRPHAGVAQRPPGDELLEEAPDLRAAALSRASATPPICMVPPAAVPRAEPPRDQLRQPRLRPQVPERTSPASRSSGWPMTPHPSSTPRSEKAPEHTSWVRAWAASWRRSRRCATHPLVHKLVLLLDTRRTSTQCRPGGACSRCSRRVRPCRGGVPCGHR